MAAPLLGRGCGLLTNGDGHATYPTAPGTSLYLPVTPFCWAGRDDHGAQGSHVVQLEQDRREQTLLALHRLGERLISPPRRPKVRAGMPMWVSLLVGYHKPKQNCVWHHGAQGNQWSAIPQAGNTPPSPTGAAALMTQFALISR